MTTLPSTAQPKTATATEDSVRPTGGPPRVELPKGGGSIRGIDEKFTATAATGAGSFSVPIAASAGRSGFGPQLSLGYESSAGNGVFGLGWALALPSITRKTSKGLPQYRDAQESDVYILSGAEDLVPMDEGKVCGGYVVHRYRPRVEGLFARIERWCVASNPADVHWRSISKENVLTVYGFDARSRIADPQDEARIFTWLVCESRDDKGNAMVYDYKAEDGVGADLASAHQRNRGPAEDSARTANRYLKRIRYGNRVPLIDAQGHRPHVLTSEQTANASWMFELVWDYGDHRGDAPTPEETSPWFHRADAFSNWRSGFEVRTARRCERVLMFHHFPDDPEVGANCLVRSTDLGYSDATLAHQSPLPCYTYLVSAAHSGYRRSKDGYLRRSLPPVEFKYSTPQLDPQVREFDTAALENLPAGSANASFQWVDLHGEGIPGLLSEQAHAWYYKRNLSAVDGQTVRFAALEQVATQPNAPLGSGAQFMDLAGDGQLDLVMLDGPLAGFCEHDTQEGWQPFKAFTSRLNRNSRDRNLRLIDLDGNGLADVLVSEDDAFVWHPSLGEQGFGAERRVHKVFDEELGPRVIFANAGESIFLADLSGDGLTDIVRIRNGEICYWPNLGYGRFGAKVRMDNAPQFDHPDHFEPKRLRLADIDGTGSADLIYLHSEGVRLYFNQSGNGWSAAQGLPVFAQEHDLATTTTVDLLGNGTACVLWTSALPEDVGRHMRYVDLMGGTKPHLLIGADNGLGAQTRISYASSNRFYLRDKIAGRPWVTKLPFPVHVVERVETFDHVNRNRFVSRYAYHHGYFDGEEREFRGFGMVEQWDTEEIAALAGGAMHSLGGNFAEASQVPPVHTKTWFHTGIYLGRDHISDYFAGLLDVTDHGEYFQEPGLTRAEARAMLLPDTVLPDGLTFEEQREACRALKSSVLRKEVYADDAGPGATDQEIRRARTPYMVTEQNFSVRMLQRRGACRHAVFFSHARESITYHYERNPTDPSIQHALTLQVDAYGNVLKEAAIGYGRRHSIRVVDAHGQVQQVPNPGLALLATSDQAKQTSTLLTYTENRFTVPVETAHAHRNPAPCESVTFELTGYAPTGPAGRFQGADFVDPIPDGDGRLRSKPANEVAYEAVATRGPCRRPVEWLRTLYRSDDLSRLLPLGVLEPLGLPGESYQLALTPGLVAAVFQRPRAGEPPEALLASPAAVLCGQGGYLQSQQLKADGRFPNGDEDDQWWIPSGQSFFNVDASDSATAARAQAQQHFFLPRRYRDPFGQDAFVDFDAHDLLIVETRDPLDNRVTVLANDYRVLQPRLVSDPNRNRTELAFDTLGMVAGTAVMGKTAPAPLQGDSLVGFIADLTPGQLDAFFGASDAHADASVLLKDATTRVVYDRDRFHRTRRAHPNDPSRWQPACVATVARETHASAALPPQGLQLQLSFSYSDGFGREIQKKIPTEPGPVVKDGPDVATRWITSGWTIHNNKGKPVRQYEPFFSASHQFEFGMAQGVSPVLFYDPTGRVIATIHPNQTYDKVVFDPWQQTTYDVNDTCAPRGSLTGVPYTDPDISGYVAAYFADLSRSQPPWQSWYAQRIGGALGTHEQMSATRAAAHADTPSTVHSDALGRPFLTQTRNRVVCAGHDLDGKEDSAFTRVELDIEGNRRAIRDGNEQPGQPLGRVVARYTFDMLGHCIHQLSMEAGARWMLGDVAGNPIRAWDSRGHELTTSYDALRRPLGQYVRGTSADSDPRTVGRTVLIDRIEYGEGHEHAQALNLRTRVYRHFDSAGVATHARLDANGIPLQAYDFKGNLLGSTRQLVSDYKSLPDWQLAPALDSEAFIALTLYDALNRPVQSIAPHSQRSGARVSVIQPAFNRANLLERMDVWLHRESEPAAQLDAAHEAPSPVGVAHIDYDARGQRLHLHYKNGVVTRHAYDPQTFRQLRLDTRRESNSVQNVHYTYDPVGNITRIRDDTQQTVYFRNQCVNPGNDYTYDALYRLIEATGREHVGSCAGVPNPPTVPGAGSGLHEHLEHPGNGNALGTYAERYVYDIVGNFLKMQHRGGAGAQPGWTRAYDYHEPSLIDDGSSTTPALATSNRLTRCTLNPHGADPQVETFQHDAHGNMVRMAHLGGGSPAPNMHWDCKDRLRQVDLGGGGTAFYSYDASGERIRKVCEKAPGLVEERIYLGGFEIFRRHPGPIGAGTAALERETLHVMDDHRRIALVETRTRDTAHDDPAPQQLIRYQIGNHLGSASLELDHRAQIISYEEYAPYGSATYQASRNRTEAPKRYRYTGKERDDETGMDYYGARFYAPWLGRWTAADSAGLKDGPNLYLYVGANPVNKLDPNGRWEISWTDVAIGAAGAVLVVGAVALTAGLAAGPIAAGLATAGLTTAEISALGTAAVVVGTTAGAIGTADTVGELTSGVNSSTGRPLSDAEASRRLGALPVQILATAFGIRSLSGGGGGLPPPSEFPSSFSFATQSGSIGAMTFAPPVAVAPVVVAPSSAAGIGSIAPTWLMAMMTGEGGSGGGGDGGGRSSSRDVREEIRDLPEEQQDRLLARVVRGDKKGRPFGQPSNPRMPTVDEFNPRTSDTRAGDLEELVVGGKHGINPDQASSIRSMSNDDLVRFRLEDPISATSSSEGLSLTGGHHRTAEIIRRVVSGELSPDALVRIMLHD